MYHANHGLLWPLQRCCWLYRFSKRCGYIKQRQRRLVVHMTKSAEISFRKRCPLVKCKAVLMWRVSCNLIQGFCSDDAVKIQCCRCAIIWGDVVNIFTAFVIAALVTGSISTLSSSSMQPREIVLAQMQRRLRIYAELSGIVLTLGMVFTLTWMHWPMPFIADEARSGYTALVNSVLFEFGAFYSLLIVTFYLPVAAIQSHWILKAAQLSIGHTNATPDAVSKWRLQYGLDTSHLKSIRTLLAVSAPSLASLAGGFLT